LGVISYCARPNGATLRSSLADTGVRPRSAGTVAPAVLRPITPLAVTPEVSSL